MGPIREASSEICSSVSGGTWSWELVQTGLSGGAMCDESQAWRFVSSIKAKGQNVGLRNILLI